MVGLACGVACFNASFEFQVFIAAVVAHDVHPQYCVADKITVVALNSRPL